MNRKTELRHLSPGDLYKLCKILDECGWKQVMAIVPIDANDISSKPKYKVEHIRLVESYAEKHNMSYTEILIQEWGTSGKIRPTVNTLLNVLIKAELFRAADFIAIDVLKEEAPQRPVIGPAALVNVNLDSLDSAIPTVVSEEVTGTLIHVPYSLLREISNSFCDIPYQNNDDSECTGYKLGSGAFGSVYYGEMPDGTAVAIKKLINDNIALFNQFKTEIITLSKYRHPNLLPLLGYSCDTTEYCLIYEFMPNRSLQDRLALSFQCKRAQDILSWPQRLVIAVGVCYGIHHLHTFQSPPLIHRDVKTANILLDQNMNARLGDFGLVRTSPYDSRMTSTIFGTSAYMAPEAFRGDVSVKTDVFSVGVVLLELLTAQPPYDSTREGADLVTFIEDSVDTTIAPLLDASASWDTTVADRIFTIAQQCLEDKKRRPFIGNVIELLEKITENESNV